MAYSRWHNSVWYIYWCGSGVWAAGKDIRAAQGLAVWHVHECDNNALILPYKEALDLVKQKKLDAWLKEKFPYESDFSRPQRIIPKWLGEIDKMYYPTLNGSIIAAKKRR